MRSLRERLAELQPSASRPAPRRALGTPIEDIEIGQFVPSSLGSLFVAEYPRHDPDLDYFQACPTPIPPCFLPRAPLVQPEEIVFLDTETTGLAGGTGTYAFLVGLGLIEDRRFRLRQLFMRGPAEEPALLDALQQTLSRCRLLVTFNGRSFDWPLLETRFILHGFRPRFDFEHLDILHPARRVWKHRLRDCSLGNLEGALLGPRRELDVPGFLIPQLYFDYLRDGDACRLRAVFAHNREDIITMARLTARLLAAVAEPETVLSHPADRAGLGLLLIARGEMAAGLKLLSGSIAENGLAPDLRRRAEAELTRSLKRLGRTPEAVPMLLAMCDRAAHRRPLDLFPFEELAKYYEHEARELEAAVQTVERALRLLELRAEYDGREALLHRVSRLRRKQLGQMSIATRPNLRDVAGTGSALP